MTTLINRDPRFGLITGFGAPTTAARIIILGGVSRKILLAQISGGAPVLLGESEDLGGEVLAANGESSPNYHVLTSNGLVRVSSANNPAIVSSHAFDPGGGRWLALFGSFIAVPLKKGGIQVRNATTGAVVSSHMSSMQSSQFAASDSSTGRLWVVDQLNASLSTFSVSSATGAITFLGKIRAPSCRDVIKVVVDLAEEYLFVLCRNRIVRFTIPTSSDTPTFAQDYGVAAAPYTDFVVLEADKYWVGQAWSRPPSPLDLYYGPPLGVWEASTRHLVVAAPQSSLWSVNTVTPYYTVGTLVGTLSAAPPTLPVLTAAYVVDAACPSCVTGGVADTYSVSSSGVTIVNSCNASLQSTFTTLTVRRTGEGTNCLRRGGIRAAYSNFTELYWDGTRWSVVFFASGAVVASTTAWASYIGPTTPCSPIGVYTYSVTAPCTNVGASTLPSTVTVST